MFFERLEHLVEVLQNCIVTTNLRAIDQNEGINVFHQLMRDVKKNNGKIYVIGNGGSAGIASHFSNDLLKALEIPSLTLVDSNVMTCFANDYGYEHVYSKPLSLLMNSDDLLVAISSSGGSKNIINAVETANTKDAKVLTLSGFSSENPLRKLGYLNFWIDISDYGLVEAAHFFLLHTVSDLYGKNKRYKEKKILKELCRIN
jgi:D-sedoheptulose 7-phosphate isomerase